MSNEPDIIQRLSVDFNVVPNISVSLNTTPQAVQTQFNGTAPLNADLNSDQNFNAEFNSNIKPLDAQFGTVYIVGGNCKVLYASTATWNSKPQLIAEKGYIYIYSDYRQNIQGQNIASMKVGDGTSYLLDMPFTDELLYSHLSDTISHITSEERTFWNNKVRCYINPEDSQNLIFTIY